MSTTLEFRVSGTFSLNAMPRIVTVVAPFLRLSKRRTHSCAMRWPTLSFILAGRKITDSVGQDDLRFVARLLRAIGQVIRIDPDAVAADQPRSELVKIPFGAGGGEHVASIDAKAIE